MGLSYHGCTLARTDCECVPDWDAARVCRYRTESPFVLEFERQHGAPTRRRYAAARAFAALHEAGHAVIAYQHLQHASIHIPFNDPLAATMRVNLGSREPRANAAAFYAGAVINKLLLGTIDHAVHDVVSCREKLDEFYDPCVAKLEQHKILHSVIRQLIAYWPSVESIATDALKVERLRGRDFDKAARCAGLDTGPRRKRQLLQAQLNHLNRYSKSPQTLLSKLGDWVPNAWRDLLHEERMNGRAHPVPYAR